MVQIYQDRRDAGRVLGQALKQRGYADRLDLLVLALPRGGVPVAYEVARILDAPLDLILVRKLGLPGHEELAMGAIASGGVRVLNDDVVDRLHVSAQVIDSVAQREGRELERRERAYRGNRTPPVVAGRTVILIDDGLATGSTMLAAVRAVRQQRPAMIVVAVPVAPPETCRAFLEESDDVMCTSTPETFGGVGAWYRDFEQTTDEQVTDLLQRAWESHSVAQEQR